MALAFVMPFGCFVVDPSSSSPTFLLSWLRLEPSLLPFVERQGLLFLCVPAVVLWFYCQPTCHDRYREEEIPLVCLDMANVYTWFPTSQDSAKGSWSLMGPSMTLQVVPLTSSTTMNVPLSVAVTPFHPHVISHWPRGGEAC